MAFIRNSIANPSKGFRPQKPMSKVTFLRLILIEICATSVHMIINFLLAANLPLKNQRSSTAYYGIFCLLLPWIPSLFIIPHEIYYKSCLLTNNNKLLILIVGIVFFPILPFILFVLMVNKKRDTEYVNRFIRIHDIRNIMLMSINLIVLLLMVLRSTAVNTEDLCMIDILGRLVCVSSPLIVNSILSVFLLMFSGISNYLQYKATNGIMDQISEGIAYLPFLCCDMLVRIASYAFILNYIDYWAIIPISCILLFNIITYGYFQTLEIPDTVNDIDAATDDVDGAYALIWTGSEWTCSKPLECDQTKQPGSKVTERISPVIKGFISSLLFFPLREHKDTLKWSMFCCYLNTGILSVVIAVIYVLVNYIPSFNYNQNILNNEIFKNVTYLLISIATLYPLLLILTIRHIKSKSATIASLIICLFLAIIIFLSQYSRYILFSSNSLFMYTLLSKSDVSYVNVHQILNFGYFEFNEHYSQSEIYFDLSCQNRVTEDHRLLFINRFNNACQFDLKNKTASYFFVEDDGRRSSSPKFGTIKFKDFSEVRSQVSTSGDVFFSGIEPTPDMLKKHYTCSNSTTVHIQAQPEHVRSSIKYMDSSGVVSEVQTIFINEKSHKIVVPCMFLDSNVRFIKDNHELKPYSFASSVKPPSFACCLNDTHSLSLFGSCKNINFPTAKVFHLYQLGVCSRLNTQDIVSFQFDKSCLFWYFYRALCDDITSPLRNACKFDKCTENSSF